jgi:hypothetical protein
VLAISKTKKPAITNDVVHDPRTRYRMGKKGDETLSSIPTNTKEKELVF